MEATKEDPESSDELCGDVGLLLAAEKQSDEKSSSEHSSSESGLGLLYNVTRKQNKRPEHYTVRRWCRVRTSEDKSCGSIVKDLASGTRVKVVTIRNNRARIVHPVVGWISVTTKKGPMLRKTYRS